VAAIDPIAQQLQAHLELIRKLVHDADRLFVLVRDECDRLSICRFELGSAGRPATLDSPA
jgi:hypothetical protein